MMFATDQRRRTAMLAEKFLLLLETLRSNAHDDGAPRVISTSPHIAIDLASSGSSQIRQTETSRRAGR
jgi:hypothetical protein